MGCRLGRWGGAGRSRRRVLGVGLECWRGGEGTARLCAVVHAVAAPAGSVAARGGCILSRSRRRCAVPCSAGGHELPRDFTSHHTCLQTRHAVARRAGTAGGHATQSPRPKFPRSSCTMAAVFSGPGPERRDTHKSTLTHLSHWQGTARLAHPGLSGQGYGTDDGTGAASSAPRDSAGPPARCAVRGGAVCAAPVPGECARGDAEPTSSRIQSSSGPAALPPRRGATRCDAASRTRALRLQTASRHK